MNGVFRNNNPCEIPTINYHPQTIEQQTSDTKNPYKEESENMRGIHETDVLTL